MMDVAIVEDKNTVLGRVWVHDREKAFEPQQELVSVVASLLDVATDNPICWFLTYLHDEVAAGIHTAFRRFTGQLGEDHDRVNSQNGNQYTYLLR